MNVFVTKEGETNTESKTVKNAFQKQHEIGCDIQVARTHISSF